jgi:hypothetical protein
MTTTQFGSINAETGEVSKGYIDKSGKMCYRKPPFWKRWFSKPPTEDVYVGVVSWPIINMNTGVTFTQKGVLYLVRNKITQKTVGVYVKSDGERVECNLDAWLNQNRIIAS